MSITPGPVYIVLETSVVDPDPHGSGTCAWIRKSENSKLDPDPE